MRVRPALSLSSRITDGFDFRVECNQPFGDDSNVVTQALDDVEVTPSSNAFLANLSRSSFDSPNFSEASVDVLKACPDRNELS